MSGEALLKFYGKLFLNLQLTCTPMDINIYLNGEPWKFYMVQDIKGSNSIKCEPFIA